VDAATLVGSPPDTEPINRSPTYSDETEDRILKAGELITEEIARMEKRGAHRPSNPSHAELEEEAKTLECAVVFCGGRRGIPEKGRPSAYLDKPVGLIDCGEAGKLELFTASQVEAARERSGRTRYVTYLQRGYDALSVADRVLDRAKARAERIEREKLEAKEAITTKLDDLPPLPRTLPPPLPKDER
jgi:hypothetical protein